MRFEKLSAGTWLGLIRIRTSGPFSCERLGAVRCQKVFKELFFPPLNPVSSYL